MDGVGDVCAEMIFVDASAPSAADGTGWLDAFTTLQEALDAAPAGGQLWVAGSIGPRRSKRRSPGFVITRGQSPH